MNSERWSYIKALQVPAPRMVHVSKTFGTKQVEQADGTIKNVQVVTRTSTFFDHRNLRKQAVREDRARG